VLIGGVDIFKNLQDDILRLQGFKSSNGSSIDVGLGPITAAFPNSVFPLGAVHEFLSTRVEDSASTNGFVAGLISSISGCNGATVWISSSRKVFAPALKSFGVEPDRFIFLDLQSEKDIAWAMDEALKCSALSAVVAEVREIDFTASRRLQLAVERSKVTGFILRHNYRKLNTTACVSRWRITPLLSNDMERPGMGFPKWKVELLRMRNGKTGTWLMEWIGGRFVTIPQTVMVPEFHQKKAG
jgi:protein ImuA